MPRVRKNRFKGIQRQFVKAEEGFEEVNKTSSEKKLGSADRLRPISKPNVCNDFVAVEGSRVMDMGLLQDALTKAHVCPEGI